MSSVPRRTPNQTDAEYKAILAEIGKRNEEMYGKKNQLPVTLPKPVKATGAPSAIAQSRFDAAKARTEAAKRTPATPTPPKNDFGAIERPAPELPLNPPYKKGGKVEKPIKRAAGGAAKVRKNMMTPEGKILHAMNKLRGK